MDCRPKTVPVIDLSAHLTDYSPLSNAYSPREARPPGSFRSFDQSVHPSWRRVMGSVVLLITVAQVWFHVHTLFVRQDLLLASILPMMYIASYITWFGMKLARHA